MYYNLLTMARFPKNDAHEYGKFLNDRNLLVDHGGHTEISRTALYTTAAASNSANLLRLTRDCQGQFRTLVEMGRPNG